MNWEDEPWIKEYTRDTLGFRVLPWQGRCIGHLIRRKANRDGVIDLDGFNPTTAISVLIDVPEEVVDVGLDALIKNGTLSIVGDNKKLMCNNFTIAQSARQSGKIRQQKYRDKKSLNVTDESHALHSVTNRIEENRIDQNRRERVRAPARETHSNQNNVPILPSWRELPLTWQKVWMCLEELANLQGDAKYHKSHLEDICKYATAEVDPVNALQNAVESKVNECNTKNQRFIIRFFAADFYRYLEVSQTKIQNADDFEIVEIPERRSKATEIDDGTE